MVEHVQKEHSALWWAASATGYCVVVALAWAGLQPDFRDLAWTVGGVSAALTLLPQPFRRRRGFRVACWITVTLVVFFGFLTFMFGGVLFLPAALPLLVPAAVPPRAAPGRGRVSTRTAPGMARAGVVTGLVIVLVAYAGLVLFGR